MTYIFVLEFLKQHNELSPGSFRGLTVAVKQLHNLIISRHNQAKFLREMEISATIRHPNILQFLCCAQQDR